ncbi:MAG: hypothetical protein AAB110_07670 [Candidatus Desantisbacteria bacterium]
MTTKLVGKQRLSGMRTEEWCGNGGEGSRSREIIVGAGLAPALIDSTENSGMVRERQSGTWMGE